MVVLCVLMKLSSLGKLKHIFVSVWLLPLNFRPFSAERFSSLSTKVLQAFCLPVNFARGFIHPARVTLSIYIRPSVAKALELSTSDQKDGRLLKLYPKKITPDLEDEQRLSV